jgi:hypothetical protein
LETKPGIYTTEFWVMLLSNVVGLANLTGIWDYVPNNVSVLFMAIVSALYTVSRGQAKKGVGYDPGYNYTGTTYKGQKVK